jgi:hypothetical protein
MKKHLLIIAVVICLMLVIQGLAAFTIYHLLPSWTERGQFGDMFGAVNTFFSACAFAGIIFTILLQREELELQRKELELTRAELKRSALAQEKSEYALSRQAKAADVSARLTAINFLFENCAAEIERLTENDKGANTYINKVMPLEKRRQQLLTMMGEIFDQEVAQDEQNDR